MWAALPSIHLWVLRLSLKEYTSNINKKWSKELRLFQDSIHSPVSADLKVNLNIINYKKCFFFILIVCRRNLVFCMFEPKILSLESPKSNQFSTLKIQTICYKNELLTTFHSWVTSWISESKQTHRKSENKLWLKMFFSTFQTFLSTMSKFSFFASFKH